MNPFTPYLHLIRPVLACVVLSVAFFGGCHVQKGRNADKLAAKDATIVLLTADKNTLADALNEVNAKAEQAKRDAKTQADKAAQAVKDADKAGKQYARDLDKAEDALQRASRSPECKAKLSEALCVDLL